MPKQNYHQVRKQKEQARKARQQAKQERRTTRPGTGEEGSEAPANDVTPAPELIPPAA
jgi:hypothetical protein